MTTDTCMKVQPRNFVDLPVTQCLLPYHPASSVPHAHSAHDQR